MNNVSLIGRLGKDPDIRYTTGQDPMCVARYTLAVDRGDRNRTTDWIPCVAFGRMGEWAEKHLHKGMKIGVTGRIQTGKYTNREGRDIFTYDVVVSGHYFCESKSVSDTGNLNTNSDSGQTSQNVNYPQGEATVDGFMNIPEGIDEELPFT